jgi:hypothetical protein
MAFIQGAAVYMVCNSSTIAAVVVKLGWWTSQWGSAARSSNKRKKAELGFSTAKFERIYSNANLLLAGRTAKGDL